MVIKIGLSGDMHVNVPKREEEAQRIAWWMGEDWRARGVHLIGIAGDLVDGPLSERQRAWLIRLIDFYASIAPVVLIDGNHEIALALRNAVGGRHGKYPVIVEDGAGVHVVDTTAGQVAVPCVSFPKKARLLAAVGGVASNDQIDAIAGQALRDIFRGLGVRVRELGLPTVALVHGTIKGSKISADDQPDRPLGLDIPLADIGLISAGFYNVAHIHKAQHWTLPDGAVVATPSCPFFSDYGEARHEKGYILAEIKPFERPLTSSDPAAWLGDWKNSLTWQRIPTPATPMLLVESEFKEVYLHEEQEEQWLLVSPSFSDLDGNVQGVDVRLRYRFPSEQRQAAKGAAEAVATTLREHGAVNVTLDPVLIPTVRARIPELADTLRLEDKWLLYVKSIGLELSDGRRETLLEYLRLLQEEAVLNGVEVRAAGQSAPVLKKIRLRGFLKFPDEVTIDFDQLEGELTAIIAPNEMGKSVLIQIMGPGLNYGTTPDRGSLDDLSIARDSFAEGTFEMGGQTYTLTQNANGKDRKGTVSLVLHDPVFGRVPMLEKAGRDEYKSWRLKNFLPMSVYNALICRSGSESILDMDDGPRMEVLNRVLGIEGYETLAKSARDKADATLGELNTTRTRIADIGIVDVATKSAEVDAARGEQQRAEDALGEAQQTLSDARARSAEVEQLRREYSDLRGKELELTRQRGSLEASVTDLRTRLDQQRLLLDQADNIHQAVSDAEDLTQRRSALQQQHQELRVQYSTEYAARGSLSNQREDYAGQRDAVQVQVDGLEKRLRAVGTALQSERNLVADADHLREVVKTVTELRQRLAEKNELRTQHQVTQAQVEGRLSELTAKVSGNSQRQGELQRRINAARALTVTATTVRDAVAQIPSIEAAVRSWEEAKKTAQASVDEVTLRASELSSERITGLRDGLSEIAEDRVPSPQQHAREVLKADHDKVSRVSESVDTLNLLERRELLRIATESLATVQTALADARVTASRLGDIQAAEVVLEEAMGLLEQAQLERIDLDESIGTENRLMDELERETEQLASDIRWLTSEIEGYAVRLARAEALPSAEARIEALEQERSRLLDDHGTLEKRQAALATKIEILIGEEGSKTILLSEIGRKSQTLSEQIKEVGARLEDLQPLVTQAPALAEAKVRKEHLEAEMGNAIQRLDDVLDPLGNLCDRIAALEPLPESVDIAPREQAVRELETSVRNCHGRVATALRDLTDEETRARRLEELSGKMRDLEVVQANWKLLGDHLGKDHLQKAEISCAAAPLTDRTNELLRAAGDTRHTVSIETERLHSNKKQMVPCLNINVFDSEEGITKESRLLSGAGKGIVGLPYTLAMILLGCQRAGVMGPTMFLDEATGVMDEVNAPRYIGMVRRFAEILGARVLYVAQQRSIQELADSFITIDNGKVTVQANV